MIAPSPQAPMLLLGADHPAGAAGTVWALQASIAGAGAMAGLYAGPVETATFQALLPVTYGRLTLLAQILLHVFGRVEQEPARGL